MKKSLLRSLALLVVFAAPAAAGDFWVDAVNGSDANGGTSPGDAWRTITFALSQVPAAGPDTLHVLPGLYDQPHGERYPIPVRPELTIRGEGTRDAVVVRGVPPMGGPATRTIQILSSPLTGVARLEHLTVEGGTIGVAVDAWLQRVAAELEDVAVVGAGIGVDSIFPFGAGVDLVLVDVDVSGASVGLSTRDVCDAFGVMVDAERCSFTGCGTGVFIYNSEGFDNRVTLTRSRITDNTRGILLQNDTPFVGSLLLQLRSCLVARNAMNGIDSDEGSIDVSASTVASNGGAGVRLAPAPVAASASVTSSILYGNADDVDGPIALANTNVGDGDQVGTNGNISVDPLFFRPGAGDFRLGFTSACVDALPAAAALDLAGFARDNDGDLDLTTGADLGAYELRNLAVPETARIGHVFQVLLLGPPGQFTVLSLSRMGLVSSPASTPFGPLWLDPLSVELVATRKLLDPTPERVTIALPNAPVLIGLEIGFQALTRSPLAPAGAAWSDPGLVTVVP